MNMTETVGSPQHKNIMSCQQITRILPVFPETVI